MASNKRQRRSDTDEQKYIRPADVVRQTGLSKSAVFAALWSGELEAYRKGRAWLIPVDAVDHWIKDDTNAA